MTIRLTKMSLNVGAHYCGRLGRNKLGNPFTLNHDGREEIVQGFRHYLNLVAVNGYNPPTAARAVSSLRNLTIASTWKPCSREEFMTELENLLKQYLESRQLTLGCHCCDTVWTGEYKNVCHTEAIASYISWRASQ